MKQRCLAIWALWWGGGLVAAQTFDASAEMRKMIAAARSVQTLRYELHKWERIEGKMMHEKNIIKWRRSPFSVYIKIFEPQTMEVLYVAGKNNGKALVNPGKFMPNLNLDPYGELMRRDQHHTIFATGFDYTVTLIEHSMNKYKDRAGEMHRYLGEETVHGRLCHKIELFNPNFRFVPYVVQSGENLTTIARKLKVSEWLILENNPSVKSYDDVSAGQTI
ncbi:MAG: DUF1571 domain-containing protein, partial [Bacteroidia bacterium]|nr:DUF1571 domain-containing protein [Bacteroidia bacterium]